MYICVITSSVMSVLHEEEVVLFDEMDQVSMLILQVSLSPVEEGLSLDMISGFQEGMAIV